MSQPEEDARRHELRLARIRAAAEVVGSDLRGGGSSLLNSDTPKFTAMMIDAVHLLAREFEDEVD